ncbi:MAG: CHAP domain-containing protein [Gammaproteobacteria bacterium]
MSRGPTCFAIGTEVHCYLGIPVFENGADKNLSHGLNFSEDNGYYYGQKWQCVEYVKRFYDRVLNHRMPHVWGHAKDYFDDALDQGGLNTRRGLVQFQNGGNFRPQIHDILVFGDTFHGHLAIVSKVTDHTVEVVQQNIAGKPLECFRLTRSRDTFLVDAPRTPKGWLRLE